VEAEHHDPFNQIDPSEVEMARVIEESLKNHQQPALTDEEMLA